MCQTIQIESIKKTNVYLIFYYKLQKDFFYGFLIWTI